MLTVANQLFSAILISFLGITDVSLDGWLKDPGPGPVSNHLVDGMPSLKALQQRAQPIIKVPTEQLFHLRHSFTCIGNGVVGI